MTSSRYVCLDSAKPLKTVAFLATPAISLNY